MLSRIRYNEAGGLTTRNFKQPRGHGNSMEHIRDFTIQSFRGLKDLEMKQLGQINLLVGNNNSGKTSVLEALSIFCDPLNWRRWNEAGLLREEGALRRSPLTERILWLFPQRIDIQATQTAEDAKILLFASGDFPIEKVSASYEKYMEIINLPRSSLRLEALRLEEGEAVLEIEEVEAIKVPILVTEKNRQPTLFEDELLSKILQDILIFIDAFPTSNTINRQKTSTLQVQIVTSLSHHSNSLPPKLWTDVIEADLKKDTIDLLRFFDPNIQEIDIISPSERRQFISVKHAKLGRAPLHTFGDGLRRVFTLATTIVRARGGLLLIDELETAIHTKALEKTIDWLTNACLHNNVQLVATTHSLEAVDTTLEVCRNNASFVVYRLEEGQEKTTARRFDKELLIRLREELGMEVR